MNTYDGSYKCVRCDSRLTASKYLICKYCMAADSKLKRINYKKEYKNKGYTLSVTSNFKSADQTVQNILNNKNIEILPVKKLNPEDFEVSKERINDFDYAKLLAIKYKNVCPVLKNYSKQKIRNEKQVRCIFYYVNKARKKRKKENDEKVN